jgi:hypothetical protein
MSRGDESNKFAFSDRDEDTEDLGYGGGGSSSYDEDDDEEGGWSIAKERDDLWDDAEDADREDDEELAGIGAGDAEEDEGEDDDGTRSAARCGDAPAGRRKRPPRVA